MPTFDSPLNNLSIASPCPADWEQMYGDERKRFCGDCKLNVYNLSGMTRDEAERLVTNHEGRLCVRYYRRADGSVITADCPVGWAKIKQRTRLYATAVASLVMALFTGVLFVGLFSKDKPTIGILRVPFATPTPEPTTGVMAPMPRNTNSNAVQGKPTLMQGGATNADAIPKETPKTKFEIGKMRVLPGDRKNG